jgi:hypothetical protein
MSNYSQPNLENDTDHELLFKAAYAQWLIEQSGGGGGGSLPPQTGHAGEFLTTDGSDASWAALAYANLPSQSASTLLGRGASGAGVPQVISLGPNLSISGTTLNASGGGTPAGANTQVQFNNSGAFGASANLTWSNVGLVLSIGSLGNGANVELYAAAGGLTTLGSASTSNHVVEYPDATGTAVLEDNSATLTNKTISGASNTFSMIPASVLSAGTLAANITLGEGAGNLVLDSTLSADGTYSGILQAGTAGATLAFGDICYFSVTDSRWELADATDATTAGSVMLGMCVQAAASDGSATTMLLWGKIRADTAFPSFTVGAPVYISETAGDLTETQPSTTDAVIRVVGFSQTADAIWFTPSSDYMTHV